MKSNYKLHKSETGSGFTRKVSNWDGKKEVHPDNVLELPDDTDEINNVLTIATESRNVEHSAAFPVLLPQWFINLLSKKDDIILDPFMGSGTTAIAAISSDRRYIGIEVLDEYINISNERINKHLKK